MTASISSLESSSLSPTSHSIGFDIVWCVTAKFPASLFSVVLLRVGDIGPVALWLPMGKIATCCETPRAPISFGFVVSAEAGKKISWFSIEPSSIHSTIQRRAASICVGQSLPNGMLYTAARPNHHSAIMAVSLLWSVYHHRLVDVLPDPLLEVLNQALRVHLDAV